MKMETVKLQKNKIRKPKNNNNQCRTGLSTIALTQNFGVDFDPLGIVVSVVSIKCLEYITKGGLFM